MIGIIFKYEVKAVFSCHFFNLDMPAFAISVIFEENV